MNASENKWVKFQVADSDHKGTQVKNQKRILDKERICRFEGQR